MSSKSKNGSGSQISIYSPKSNNLTQEKGSLEFSSVVELKKYSTTFNAIVELNDTQIDNSVSNSPSRLKRDPQDLSESQSQSLSSDGSRIIKADMSSPKPKKKIEEVKVSDSDDSNKYNKVKSYAKNIKINIDKHSSSELADSYDNSVENQFKATPDTVKEMQDYELKDKSSMND